MATDSNKQKKRLRQYLNPSIKGKNTDSILDAVAPGLASLVNNIEAVTDQLYLVSASGKYLDQRLSERNVVRPEQIGISDEIAKEIGIEVSNRKQVRSLINKLLEIMYGVDFTRATSKSNQLEPYFLENGDSIILEFDNQDSLEIPLSSDQFSNINFATAQEVADAITKGIRKLGGSGAALAKDDGVGGYIQLISEANGPASSIRVLGGKAQNKIQFDSIRPTTGSTTTQWTLTQVAGGSIRATWSGGPTPSIGKVRKDDYVNIYGTSFNTNNRGTFTITKVKGGLVNDAYVEFNNPNGFPETKLQGTTDAILFFNPVRTVLTSKLIYATTYQTEAKLLEVFIPATTKVVRRGRKGSAHIVDSGSSGGDYGPYIFDTSKTYQIGSEEANTIIAISADSSNIIPVDDASSIPDSEGFLVFDFGGKNEEGPIPYISRPSSNNIIISPSYKFKKNHNSGTNISLINRNFSYPPLQDGSDFAFYITDVVSGRIYAEDLVKEVMATGITLVITVIYPDDNGLAKGGTEFSEKTKIWGK